EDAARAAVTSTIDKLRRKGRKIVIVEPIPVSAALVDPLTCLSKAKYLDDCRYVAYAKPTQMELYFRSIADGRSVYTIDLDRLVCPYRPSCGPGVGGVVVKPDRQHITAEFSAAMATPVGQLLVRDGIITPRPGG